jgi:hypothetical protein
MSNKFYGSIDTVTWSVRVELWLNLHTPNKTIKESQSNILNLEEVGVGDYG